MPSLASIPPLRTLNEDVLSDRAQKLEALLNQPRSEGGFGGQLTYADFAALCKPYGWSVEVLEDCWYDVLQGIPTADTRDMQRVAQAVCSYWAVWSSDAAGSSQTSHSSAETTDTFCISQLSNAALPEHLAKESTPTVRPQGPSTASVVNHRLPPRSVKAVLLGPRFAEATVSSVKREEAIKSSGMRPTRCRVFPPSAKAAAVFDRLYVGGMQHHERRRTAALVVNEPDSTFMPVITPYDTPRRAVGCSEPCHKPTQSFYAKLACHERHYDPIAEAPETERVTFVAPPGPSRAVPNGYVESVARLRRSAAGRRHRDFESSLRSCSERSDSGHAGLAERLATPIIRLPSPSGGGRTSVDVRLAESPRYDITPCGRIP